MAGRRVIQSFGTYVGFGMVWALFAGVCAAGLIIEPHWLWRDLTVILSASMTFSFMVIGWVWMTSYPILAVARFVWTLGFLMLLVHIAIAFGVAHGWSHGAAVDHVRQTAGFGGGIVVNYLFAAVWFADVLWWWVSPTSHASRPRWVGWVVQGFLAFVVVNATVVFGPPARREAYGLVLILTLLLWLATRTGVIQWRKRLDETHKPGRRPGSEEAPQSTAGHSPT